jgi:hypothetical protein
MNDRRKKVAISVTVIAVLLFLSMTMHAFFLTANAYTVDESRLNTVDVAHESEVQMFASTQEMIDALGITVFTCYDELINAIRNGEIQEGDRFYFDYEVYWSPLNESSKLGCLTYACCDVPAFIDPNGEVHMFADWNDLIAYHGLHGLIEPFSGGCHVWCPGGGGVHYEVRVTGHFEGIDLGASVVHQWPCNFSLIVRICTGCVFESVRVCTRCGSTSTSRWIGGPCSMRAEIPNGRCIC